MHTLPICAGALLIEAACGYPAWLFRQAGHPVTWIGALIAALDRSLNRDTMPPASRRAMGVLAEAVLLLAVLLPAMLLQAVLPLVLVAVLAASLPAQRSLWTHVRAVADGLDAGLDEGRAAVSRIVGRNPQALDAAGVARAAIESLAENFSDGIVAPALWGAVAGLPGMAAYKAINTADSMVGHRTPRYLAYGWAAARLDDLVNLPASRLAALWLVLAALLLPGADPRAALQAVWRDAPHHRSPNAGWPEAAMAGALGLRLAGPRVYGTTRIEDGWMGNGRPGATAADVRRALSLYRLACAIQLAVVLGLALAWL